MSQLVQRGFVSAPERRGRTMEFRLIFWVSFVVFLMAAIAGRLLPSHWRHDTRSVPKSLIAEARAAAHTFVPIVFMG